MNEAGNTAEEQNTYTRAIINYASTLNPDCAIVLVSAFHPNFRQADGTIHCSKLSLQEQGFYELAEEYEGVVVAPVLSVTQSMLAVKNPMDYTHNGFNHPNDFGAKIYAAVISSIFSYNGAKECDVHTYTDCVTDTNCNICGAANTTMSHTGGTATCVDKKVCTACGKAYGEVNKNNHKSKTNYKAVASTCTKKGSTAGFKCAACGVDTRKSVAVKAHTYSHDCDNTCNVCKKPTRKTSHSLSANYVSKKATEKANGIISKKCTKKGCTYVKTVSTIYKIKTIKLSKTSYTYTGKAITPSVSVKDSKGKTISSKYYTVKYASGRKNVGKYKVTVTFKGNYSGTKTLYFTINPKATKISSLKAAKKAFTVKYSKQTSGSGYEIQYSTSSKFKSAKTVKVTSNKTVSKTIKKLSAKKTYYVCVRVVKGSYKSAWSKVSKVKTK